MGHTEPARAVMSSGSWANLHGDLAGSPQRAEVDGTRSPGRGV